MFGYPDLDAGWNISWFLGVMAFPKQMKHSTLNNRISGQETMAIKIMIVVRTSSLSTAKMHYLIYIQGMAAD